MSGPTVRPARFRLLHSFQHPRKQGALVRSTQYARLTREEEVGKEGEGKCERGGEGRPEEMEKRWKKQVES